MHSNKQLALFLKPYSKDIQVLLFDLREIVFSVDPDVNELIWDNYNAVAIAYGKSKKLSDAFCHLAVYTKHVNLGLNRGAELNTDGITLEGKGKLIRHIKVRGIDDLNLVAMRKVLEQALDHSVKLNPDLVNIKCESASIVMSISEKKIRPDSAT